MAPRDFSQLESELKQAVSNLKDAKDPTLRRERLLKLRLLLAEIDQLLLEASDSLNADHRIP